MSKAPTVRLERDGALAQIVLGRPEAGNAIDLELVHALGDTVDACAADAGIRAVLLRAEGKAFCVGGDLAEFAAKDKARPAHLDALAHRFHAVQARLMTLHAPVVVAIHGPVAGAGVGLALCGDLVFAGSSAHFTLAYTAIGLSANGGSTYLLPRLVGLRRAQELLFTNRRLTAAEALDWGLVTTVTPDEELRGRAEAAARTLAEGPTQAYGAIKQLLAVTYERTFTAQTDDEGRRIAWLSGGADAAEGIAAFRAKRAPTFTG